MGQKMERYGAADKDMREMNPADLEVFRKETEAKFPKRSLTFSSAVTRRPKNKEM